MTTILALYVTAVTAVQTRLQDEEGQTSLEWLGIGAVVVAIIGAVLANATDLGDAVAGVFNSMVGSIFGG